MAVGAPRAAQTASGKPRINASDGQPTGGCWPVARCTLRAIERNQALVYPGREARMAALMHRIAPGLLARMIRG